MNKRKKLFILIKTMNRGEKRAFKLYAKKYNKDNSFYIRLFDVMNKMESYDEKIIKTRTLHTDKDAKQFPVIKNQLFNMLLGSLQKHKSKNISSFQSNTYLNSYLILMDRGMYEEAVNYLLKAEKTAEKTEDFPLLISILDKKKNVYQRILNPISFIEKIQSISKKKKEYLKILDIEDWFAKQYHEAYHLYRLYNGRFPKEITEQTLKIQSQLNEKKSILASIRSKHYFYLAQTILSYSLEDDETSINYVEKHIQLMKENPFFLQINTNEYLKSINNFIAIKIGLKDFETALEEIKKIETELPKKLGSINKFIEQRIFEIGYSSRLSIAIENINIDDGVKLIPNIDKGIQTYKNLGMSIDRNIRLSFGVAILYFWKEKWSECLLWLDKVEDIEQETKIGPSHIFSYYRVVKVICHFELGNKALMNSIIISAKRYLIKNKQLFQIEELLLKYLKKLSTVPYSSHSEIYHVISTKLEAIDSSERKQPIQSSLRIKTWIDSKITGKRIVELLSEQK
jgi:tetratricopeptide (TPR) repeat protein